MNNEIIPIESLTAVPKGDPRTSVNFDGRSMPRAPATRRVKPAPFQRQYVDLSKHGREWKYCRADQVEKGDMVVGIGRVIEALSVIRYATRRELGLSVSEGLKVAVGTDVRITGAGGTVETHDAADQVRAFRPRDET